MKTKLLITFFVISTITNAQYIKLFDFTNDSISGGIALGSLITDGTFLYGMTQIGGTKGYGTIFKIKQDGTGYLTLLNCGDLADCGHPMGSLISSGGFLYGMTRTGGSGYCGVVFKVKPDGSEYSKLHDFLGTTGGNTDGLSPDGSLLSDGTYLYGTTTIGGAGTTCAGLTAGCGTIFKIKNDGTGYAKLLDFAGASNGTEPYGDLIYDGTFLYGMAYIGGTETSYCGNDGCGVIFKIKPDGTGYVKLLDFNGSNGAGPHGSLILNGGFLYGMTQSGGTNDYGTIFKIKPDGTGYSELHGFSGAPDGDSPSGSLISDGIFLYGMTNRGGTNDSGIIFKIKPDGTEYAVLFNFTRTSGIWPAGSLVSDGTFLYGMTPGGGANNQGVIFKINPVGMGIADDRSELDFTISPNPFSFSTTLSLKTHSKRTDKIFKEATLTVYNLYGQTVKQIENISGQTVTLYRDNLPGGLYLIRMVQNNKIFTTDKLIITDK